MRHIALVLAGSIAALGLAAGQAMAQSSVGVAGSGGHHGGGFASGLTAKSVPGRQGLSPHIGLPGIFGFPFVDSSRDRRGHHRGNGKWNHGGKHGHGWSDGRRGRWGRGDAFVWGYGWGYSDGDGYVDTLPEADDGGFFTSGGRVLMDGDRPVYDYDRGYPYQWYRGPQEAASQSPEAQADCTVESTWDRRLGKEVSVRVCRSY